MWLTIENGVQHYTMNPKKREHDNIPAEPCPPFGPTFYAPRNRLKVAFRAQSQIEWDQFLKGRLRRDWITCMDHHFEFPGSKLTGQECITKLIMSLWEHMDGLWTYRNNHIMKIQINKLQDTRWKHWIEVMTKYGRNNRDSLKDYTLSSWNTLKIDNKLETWTTKAKDAGSTWQNNISTKHRPQLDQRSIHYPNYWAQETEFAELVTSQLFERGIVAAFLFVLVETN
jgi:hypothetical protein